MKTKTPKPFRIFRVGTHTDSAGNATTFTRDQVEAMVKGYNEGAHRAPVVFGHPKGNGPAYGYVAGLELDDAGDVWATGLEKLQDAVADLMESGAYRNRSSSLYAPDHPANPTPGSWNLRHLGLLGDTPPAIKGLGDVEFGESDGTTVEFADYTMSSVGAILRGVRDLLLAKFGMEEADKAIPTFLLTDVEVAGRKAAETIPSFSEEAATMTPEEIQALQAKAARTDELEAANTALTAERDNLQTQAAQFAETQAKAARTAAVESAKADLAPLVTAGKVLPAQVQQMAEYMASLDNEAKVFEFGEHTGDNKLTARAMYLQTLGAAAPQVDYSEQTGDVNLPTDMTANALGKRAGDYMEAQAAKGITITSTQAVDAVLAGKDKA